MYAGSPYAAGTYAEGNHPFDTGPHTPGHGLITDFDPFGTGSNIRDMGDGSHGTITDFATTGGIVSDQ